MSVLHQLLFFFSFVVSKVKESKCLFIVPLLPPGIMQTTSDCILKGEQLISVNFHPQASESRGGCVCATIPETGKSLLGPVHLHPPNLCLHQEIICTLEGHNARWWTRIKGVIRGPLSDQTLKWFPAPESLSDHLYFWNLARWWLWSLHSLKSPLGLHNLTNLKRQTFRSFSYQRPGYGLPWYLLGKGSLDVTSRNLASRGLCCRVPRCLRNLFTSSEETEASDPLTWLSWRRKLRELSWGQRGTKHADLFQKFLRFWDSAEHGNIFQ